MYQGDKTDQRAENLIFFLYFEMRNVLIWKRDNCFSSGIFFPIFISLIVVHGNINDIRSVFYLHSSSGMNPEALMTLYFCWSYAAYQNLNDQ